jgi:hypothetical protein
VRKTGQEFGDEGHLTDVHLDGKALCGVREKSTRAV